jgi:hypothetical protein
MSLPKKRCSGVEPARTRLLTSIITPFCHRNARQSFRLISTQEPPTTAPYSFVPNAKLAESPGRVPRSLMPLFFVQTKACSVVSPARSDCPTTRPVELIAHGKVFRMPPRDPRSVRVPSSHSTPWAVGFEQSPDTPIGRSHVAGAVVAEGYRAKKGPDVGGSHSCRQRPGRVTQSLNRPCGSCPWHTGTSASLVTRSVSSA